MKFLLPYIASPFGRSVFYRQHLQKASEKRTNFHRKLKYFAGKVVYLDKERKKYYSTFSMGHYILGMVQSRNRAACYVIY